MSGLGRVKWVDKLGGVLVGYGHSGGGVGERRAYGRRLWLRQEG